MKNIMLWLCYFNTSKLEKGNLKVKISASIDWFFQLKQKIQRIYSKKLGCFKHAYILKTEISDIKIVK